MIDVGAYSAQVAERDGHRCIVTGLWDGDHRPAGSNQMMTTLIACFRLGTGEEFHIVPNPKFTFCATGQGPAGMVTGTVQMVCTGYGGQPYRGLKRLEPSAFKHATFSSSRRIHSIGLHSLA